MSSLINSLQLLHQMRLRSVEALTGELGQQQKLCQRYQQNLSALSGLYQNTLQATNGLAVQLNNQCGYKNHIQRIIDWQKQEQILADKQQKLLQQKLLVEARQEKAVDIVLSEHYLEQSVAQQRSEQKTSDAQSTQCWLRHRLRG